MPSQSPSRWADVTGYVLMAVSPLVPLPSKYLLDVPQLLASRHAASLVMRESRTILTRPTACPSVDKVATSSSSLHSLMELENRATTIRTSKVRDRRVGPPSHGIDCTTYIPYVIAVLPSLQFQILQLPKMMPIGIAFLEIPSRRWAEDMLSVALVSNTLCQIDGISSHKDYSTTTRLSL